jgi:hypothetical protein
MRFPKDRNDRVMLGTVPSLIGLGLAVGLSNVTINAPRQRTQSCRQPAPDGPQNPDIFKDSDPAKSAKSISH